MLMLMLMLILILIQILSSDIGLLFLIMVVYVGDGIFHLAAFEFFSESDFGTCLKFPSLGTSGNTTMVSAPLSSHFSFASNKQYCTGRGRGRGTGTGSGRTKKSKKALVRRKFPATT